MPSVRFQRLFAALLMLAYLLVGSGLARAVVWCVDESGHSHVEFNPAGDCQVACASGEITQPPNPLPGLKANSPTGGCQDIGLLSSQAKNSRTNSCLVPQIASLALPLPSAEILADSLFHSKPLHSISELPPPLALAALGTVVLLN